jgi:hypothetical protein
VHAWAQGIVTDAVPTGKREAITYNPYRAPTFTTRGGTPVTACDFIHFTSGTINGTINLVEAPNYGSIYLPAGKSGDRWMHQDEIAEEGQRLSMELYVPLLEFNQKWSKTRSSVSMTN